MYFAGRYRYRKAGVLFSALIALGFGGTPLAVFAPALLSSQWTWGTAAGALFVGLICALLLFTGFRLLRHWVVGATLLLEISDVGVSYGGRLFAWEEVRWIGGSSKHGHVQLRLKRNGEAPDLNLLVDQPLTVDRYDALIQELSSALRDKHPHVAVG